MLIWHNGAEVLECCCGHLILGNHKCKQYMHSLKLRVTRCGYNTTYRQNPLEEINLACVVCQEDAAQKEYDRQWSIDFDGYSVCSECHGKCTYGVLPKQEQGCECPHPDYW